ncbi:hypothetical protein [Corynebacterium urogenitale]
MTNHGSQDPHRTSTSGTSSGTSSRASSRDAGTYRATTPERGGFLDRDDKPVTTSTFAEEPLTAHPSNVQLPFLEDPNPERYSLWRALWVFGAVIIVIIILIVLLLHNIAGPSLGNANNIMDLFGQSLGPLT